MRWESRYKTSRAISLELDPEGAFVVHNSMSREGVKLGLEGLIVLREFATSSTPRAVLERLGSEYDLDQVEFERLVTRLLEQNLVTPESDDEPMVLAKG